MKAGVLEGGEADGLVLAGPLLHMSPPLLCKDGRVRLGFLCLYDIPSLSKQYVLYSMTDFPQWRSILVVSNFYTITNLVRLESGERADGERAWYCALKDNQCRLEPAADGAMSKRVKKQGVYFMEIGAGLLRDAAFTDFITPSTIAIKNDYEGTEICIEGVFQRYHQDSGYVEFFFKEDSASSSSSGSYYDHDEVTVGIYLTDYPLSSLESVVHLQPQRCLIRASSVLPMYLWGKLYGFAATIRSHIEVLPLCSDDDNTDRKRSRCAAVEPPGPPVCERCAMFSVWRNFVTNKLSYCIVALRATHLETLWSLLHGPLLLASTNYASSGADSLAATLPHFSQYSNISNRTLRRLKHQFLDLNYLQLYKVRNGRDSDLLTSHFAYLLSVGNVLDYVRASDAHTTLLGSSAVYDNKFYPKVVMGYFSSTLEKYHMSTQLHSRRVLVGTFNPQRLFRYSRTTGAGWSSRQVLMFELTDALDNSIKCIVAGFKSPGGEVLNDIDVARLQPLSKHCDQDVAVFIEDFSVYLEKGCQLPGLGDSGGVEICLLVDPRDIKFVYSTDASASSIAEVGTAVILETSNVRWILAHNLATAGHSGCNEICGVVVAKEIAVEQCNGKRQLLLQLKDCVHSDVITVYFLHTFDYSTCDILVASVVRLTDVFINATAKYTYVKTSVTTEIDIVGMATIDQMRSVLSLPFQNCNGSIDAVAAASALSAAAASSSSTSATVTPPDNLLCNLQKSSKTLWRFVGSVTLVKYIKCVLRCACSDRAAVAARSGNLQCSSCHSAKNLRCHWTIQCVLDDGSAEAKMMVEGTGQHVFSIVSQRDGGSCAVDGIVERVERFTRAECDSGGFYMRTFIDNPFFATNGIDDNNNSNHVNSSRGRVFEEVQAEVLYFLGTCSFPLLQVVGKCILAKTSATAATELQQKQINLQWDNSGGKLHSLQFKKVDSFAVPVHTVEARAVHKLYEEDVFAEVSRQLALLSGNFDF